MKNWNNSAGSNCFLPGIHTGSLIQVWDVPWDMISFCWSTCFDRKNRIEVHKREILLYISFISFSFFYKMIERWRKQFFEQCLFFIVKVRSENILRWHFLMWIDKSIGSRDWKIFIVIWHEDNCDWFYDCVEDIYGLRRWPRQSCTISSHFIHQ